MKPQVEKPTLAESKRVLRWMRAIYLELATKAQRGQQKRFLEPEEDRSTDGYAAGRALGARSRK
jgi:hypothetical protein